MAKVKIQGHASGTGVFTVTAPNSNTDRTITLPDADVTLGTDATKLPLAGGTLTGDLNFGDNVDANFGASDDLKIYHNGTHSIIQDSGSGDLKIWSSKVEIQSPDAGENIAIFNDDGSVELYHNNAKKIETTATGVNVTGAIGGATNLGKVLQVVQGTMNGDIFNTTSTSKTATGRSLSITPTTSGNKMLVEITGLMYNQGGSSAWGTVQIKDTTNGTYSAEHNKVGRGTVESHYTACHLFTTASTSSHNYELYSGDSDAGNKQFDNTIITIMEIAA